MNNDNPIHGTSSPDALAHDSAGTGAGANQRVVRRDVLAPFIAVAAWIVPGLGHLVLRRWGRALIFFLSVGGLAITGYLLRGNVFPPRTGEPFGTLGFLADAGAGIFYFLSRFFESAGPDVSRAAGDYGTRFIAAAGIVNLLSVFDAYEIALGRRTM
ncbi:MAG: DUF6677 family protein [Candidatus Acidiferrales bacterium]